MDIPADEPSRFSTRANQATPFDSPTQYLFPLIAPFVLGLIVAFACYRAAGVSLGLFFGPILLVTFIVPPLVMGERRALSRLFVCIALSAGVWSVWLLAANLSLQDAGRCGLVLVGYVLSLGGIASFLEFLRLGKIFPAAATVLLGALWLTWPVWMCPWLDGPHAQAIVNWLTPAHPLMSMNAILFSRFNFWDRYKLSYQQLTILNQDVLYALPGTIIWTVIVHLGIGVGGLGFPIAIKSLRGLRSRAIETS